MNQINTNLLFNNIYFLLLLSILLSACNGTIKSENDSSKDLEQVTVPTKQNDAINFNAPTASGISRDIRSIYHDKKGNYWFGTNGSGVFRYDGKTLRQFTVKDGLSNNQVQSIQEDNAGNIWFGTGVFGVSKFDGKSFHTYTNNESQLLKNSDANNWKSGTNDLWFYAGSGVYRYNENSFVYLPLDKTDQNAKAVPGSPFKLSRYAVYSIIKDKQGQLWFGTQASGVCRYNARLPAPARSGSGGRAGSEGNDKVGQGKSFTWFTENGLDGSAVLGLFEDSKGNIWFGNNGAGLFKFDPSAEHIPGRKALINFTEEKGLGNAAFKISGKPGPGTLARVYSINEDNNGNIWIGTVDAGVWRFDGNNLTNYTQKDGLKSNAINTIYKDRLGELWFGTDADGIFKFNGKSFVEFEIK